MSNTSIKNKYQNSWESRLKREPHEEFHRYERNWVLPRLCRKGEVVLDLASGNSIVGQFMQQRFGCQVIAFDISRSAIRDAKKRGVPGIVGSVEEKLPFKQQSFDTVFWGDNIEHVFFPAKIVAEIFRVLKPGGRLILSTPNQAYWRYRLYMMLKGALPKTEGEDNEPWQWQHIRFFNAKILRDLLSSYKFKHMRVIGASRRRLDRPFLRWLPELFGMILVVEATK